MKIATYNVNGINGRLPVLLRWLEEEEPDIVCLQELKAPDEKFPEGAIRDLGYHAIWQGQKSWNGVAMLSRVGEIHETRRRLPGDPDPTQSRYLEAAINGVLIAGFYLPNGNPRPGPKFDYKMAWFERLIEHAAELFATDAPVVLAGDYNVMPTEEDVYKPERWTEDALFAPEVRAAFFRLIDQGWDRRPEEAAPRRDDLHLLGLLPERLREERRTSARPSAAERARRGPVEGRGRGPAGARLGEEQRSRPDLDRARNQARAAEKRDLMDLVTLGAVAEMARQRGTLAKSSVLRERLQDKRDGLERLGAARARSARARPRRRSRRVRSEPRSCRRRIMIGRP